MMKNSSHSANWTIFDNMRGVFTGSNDPMLRANMSSDENSNFDQIEFTPTGFRLQGAGVNAGGQKYVYIAIRRPDGYVGKPLEVGTDAFAIDTGNSSSIIPSFDSGFPVDMAFYKYRITAAADWLACSRLMGTKYVITNTNATETSFQYFTWDSNVGWANESTAYATYYSWMWKRHAGFDVVTYKGDGVAGRQIPHSLNKIPEMMWVKSRDSSGNDADWQVYHKGLGASSNDPEGWNLRLNTAQAENWNNFGRWNKTVPTSTYFTLGNYDGVNKNGDNIVAMLFASVEGISKVGYYDGQNTELTITTGFQPRFLIIKKTNATSNWFVADTTRGWGANPDQILQLSTGDAQFANNDFGAPTATGFTLNGNETGWNVSGGKYIYYAHA